MNEKFINNQNINQIVRLYSHKTMTYSMNKRIKKIEKVMTTLKNTKQKLKDKISHKTISIESEENHNREYFKRSRESFKKLKVHYKLRKTQAINKKNNLIQSLHNRYDKYYELKTNKKEMKVVAKQSFLLTFGLSNLLFLYLKFSNRTQIRFSRFFILSGCLILTTNILTQMWLNSNYNERLIQLMKSNI
jgi:predicted RNase H-like nuclease (RuvC/YqgF family)